MQMVSPEEKVAIERKRETLYKAKIDVQDRITKAAALGDLSENAEYHFAKEENRQIERQIADLEEKLRNVVVLSTESMPEDMVLIGQDVKLLDLSDDTELLVHLVGDAAGGSPNSEAMEVSAQSPMGEALFKAHVGDTVKFNAPAGILEFKILEIVR